jgi:hypothetical protein
MSPSALAMSLRHNLALRMARADELPELIARTAAGDEVALAQLYDRISKSPPDVRRHRLLVAADLPVEPCTWRRPWQSRR